MGTTLQNGVYLPNEGERNCYAGLKTNWEILDQKVADVTALQQAVAGALHREIVESLPTTDIDPNTIYMILSGTSATENVYNEFMYVNNAWELIGTSATDLTNYYTKGDVDGLLVLKANASDLTSHTGDTTIHVTASDKSKWNTVALIKQLRLVNAQVGSATTIAFANIDDTNGIKVGDKCMDLDAKMFEITAVDTTNETVTVGSALIDLALDANVVHTSGNETVGGQKTFTNSIVLQNSDTSGLCRDLFSKSQVAVLGDAGSGDNTKYRFVDKNDNEICYIRQRKLINSNTDMSFCVNNIDNNNNSISAEINFIIDRNNDPRISPSVTDSISLGRPTFRWKSIYSNSYYYGNVEFSTKFVTTDTAQTISGNKTFSDNLTIYNSDDTVTPKGLTIRNAQWGMGESGGITASNINFLDKNSAVPVSIIASKGSSGQSFLRFSVRTKDSQNNTYAEEIYYNVDTSGNVSFRPWHDNIISLGASIYKWKDCQTYLVNGLTPSSLSLPSGNIADQVDISGYFTNPLTNSYTASANGWIYLRLGDISSCQAIVYDSNNNRMWGQSTTGSVEQITIPILKGQTLTTQWATNSSVNVDTARFIPCQGNI